MKNRYLLKSLSTLISGLMIFVATSCYPVPYSPQGAAYAPNYRGNPSTNQGRVAQGSNSASQSPNSTPDRFERPPSKRYPDSPPYTPPSQRPSYQPPAPRTTTTPSRTSNGSTPMATPSIKPNTVISPYPPYNVIDITGYKSGDKLCDPSTIPNDPATGRPYINPATGRVDVKRGKYFIVP